MSSIAGLWRRLVAFIADIVILGVPTLVLGLLLFRWAAGLGQAGRLVGFVVALIYFGALDSRIGGGQTLGKRLLGIRVIDRAGALLSPARTAGRCLVLVIPYFLNGAVFDADGAWGPFWDGILGTLLIVTVFGGGGAIAYLFLFNRRTRQSLHDLATGSFVVRDPVNAISAGLATPKLHLAVAACWAALMLCVPAIGLWEVHRSPSLTASVKLTGDLQAAIERASGLRRVAVVAGNSLIAVAGKATSTSFVQVTAQPDDVAADPDALIGSLAKIVLGLHPDLLGNQLLIVEVRSGFDLGIVQWSQSRRESHTATEWQAKLGLVSAKP